MTVLEHTERRRGKWSETVNENVKVRSIYLPILHKTSQLTIVVHMLNDNSSPEQVTSELRVVTCHMGSHSVTFHPTQVNTPPVIPARQAGTTLTYSEGMEGW